MNFTRSLSYIISWRVHSSPTPGLDLLQPSIQLAIVHSIHPPNPSRSVEYFQAISVLLLLLLLFGQIFSKSKSVYLVSSTSLVVSSQMSNLFKYKIGPNVLVSLNFGASKRIYPPENSNSIFNQSHYFLCITYIIWEIKGLRLNTDWM